jgi:hypothetical protein
MMSKVAATRPIKEYYRDPGPFSVRRPIDTKIQSLFSLIPKQTPSTLLASATSPRVVIDLIPGIAIQGTLEKELQRRRPKPILKKTRAGPQIPVGLARCELFPPLNGIMQLMLFLPIYHDLFTFTPRSCSALSDFIDQYSLDQEDQFPISSADINRLCRLLIQKMPPTLFRFQGVKVDVLYFIHTLIQCTMGKTSKPQNEIVWDSTLPFSCATDLISRPIELFVTIHNRFQSETCPVIQRQFFTKPDSFCYDLDAFIEYRPDGGEHQGEHIPYLKVDGAWYQCEDDRIVQMRSTYLNQALYRATLLHYKRIWPK